MLIHYWPTLAIGTLAMLLAHREATGFITTTKQTGIGQYFGYNWLRSSSMRGKEWDIYHQLSSGYGFITLRLLKIGTAPHWTP